MSSAPHPASFLVSWPRRPQLREPCQQAYRHAYGRYPRGPQQPRREVVSMAVGASRGGAAVAGGGRLRDTRPCCTLLNQVAEPGNTALSGADGAGWGGAGRGGAGQGGVGGAGPDGAGPGARTRTCMQIPTSRLARCWPRRGRPLGAGPPSRSRAGPRGRRWPTPSPARTPLRARPHVQQPRRQRRAQGRVLSEWQGRGGGRTCSHKVSDMRIE